MESIIIQNLLSLRTKNPLVHSITNYVVMNNTANALLAIGASPLMAHAHSELADIVSISSSLVINIGTLDEYWAESMILAAQKANELTKPWVLDPVGAGASAYRNAVLEKLIALKPTVIRGNASEIMALANISLQSKGVDSTHQSGEAIDAAIQLSKNTAAVVCISGEIDYIIQDSQLAKIKNGHPIMTRVTGMGCTATAIIGAFLPVSGSAFEAVCSAMAVMGIAGELAEERAKGPGSFQVDFYDSLYLLDKEDIKAKLRC
ncbi:hydroxyethylthiazole kinase [Pedobacter sp. MW01-1-1]|uniref:hydroxyethylthiazole kinase n=1 Tax=Pedobacter sp. MW01-1-1 TaxID=3383027 RepID=UPI003FF06E0E